MFTTKIAFWFCLLDKPVCALRLGIMSPRFSLLLPIAGALALSGCFSPEASIEENKAEVVSKDSGVKQLAEREVIELDFESAKKLVFENSPVLKRARETLRLARSQIDREVLKYTPVVSASIGFERVVKDLADGKAPTASVSAALRGFNLIGDNLSWYANKVAIDAAEINYQYACRQAVTQLYDLHLQSEQLAERRFWRKYLGAAVYVSTASSSGAVHAGNNDYLADFEIRQTEANIALGLNSIMGDFSKKFVLVNRGWPKVPAAAKGLGKLKARLIGAQLEGIWLKKLGAYVPLVPEVSVSVINPPFWTSGQGNPERTSWKNSTVQVSASSDYGLLRLYDIKDADIDYELTIREVNLAVEANAQVRLGLSQQLEAISREERMLDYDMQILYAKAKSRPGAGNLLEIQSALARRQSLQSQRVALLKSYWVENDDEWAVFETEQKTESKTESKA